MTPVLQQPAGHRTSHPTARIDMTPMVDLGFLLIAFFLFTTSLTQPTVMRLSMPAKTKGLPPQTVYKKGLLTAVIGDGHVWVYEGTLPEAAAANAVRQTNFHVAWGLGYSIRQKQKELAGQNILNQLIVLIKPLPAASYQHLMDALDEVRLNGVERYAILDPSEEEARLARR